MEKPIKYVLWVQPTDAMPDTPWRKIKAFSTEQDAKNFADEWCLEDGHWIDIIEE